MIRLIKDRELCTILGGCTPMTLWRYRERGQLPKPRKINGQNVTPSDVVEEAVARLLNTDDEGAAA